MKKLSNERRSFELQRLIRGTMAVRGFTTSDVLHMMSLPMSVNTFNAKLKKPEELKVKELWDIAEAIGVSHEELAPFM